MNNINFINNSLPSVLSKTINKELGERTSILDVVNINTKYAGETTGNFRCDDFTKNHSSKHILFMGDSFAAGDGLLKEETWCYKTFEKINKKENISGYFNIGCSGVSIIESIFLFFEYCKNFGNPDVVFFITTEYEREQRLVNKINSDYMIQYIYNVFEHYCNQLNIKLFSFSWLNFLDINTSEIVIPEQNKKFHPHPLHKNLKNEKRILSIFSTFYEYSVEEMMRSVWKYDKFNKKNSILAEDMLHAGVSFHDFWADFIYDKYEKNMIK